MKRAAIFGWPLLGMGVALFDALVRLAFGEVIPLDGLAWRLVAWLEWCFLAPAVVHIATAVPYRRRAWRRFLLVHFAAGLGVSAVHAAVYFLLRTIVLGEPGEPGQPLADVLLKWMPLHVTIDLLVYAGIVLAAQITLFFGALRKAEQERLALDQWLAQAELDVYKLELPVEAVNERLHEIEQTIGRDADHAERLIERFGASLSESLAAASLHARVDETARDEDELDHELPRPLPIPLRLLILFAVLPGAAVVMHTLGAVSAVVRGRPIPWATIAGDVSFTVFLFPVTLAMVWLGLRLASRSLLAAAAVVLPAVWPMAIAAAQSGWPAARTAALNTDRTLDFLMYFGVALGAQAYARYRAWRTNAVAIGELETRALRTRATILRLQLNPHFLLNALNSVAALLEDDLAGAMRMTAQLRQFVARVLAGSDRDEVPLEEELDMLRDYVAIENVRFGSRVELHIDAGEDARRALVPGFLLQPLVENAVRHGLEPDTGGRITIRASVDDGALRITVDDNGRSYDGEEVVREGLGLSTIRARLAQAFGDEFVFEMDPRRDGVRVTLEFPYR